MYHANLHLTCMPFRVSNSVHVGEAYSKIRDGAQVQV